MAGETDYNRALREVADLAAQGGEVARLFQDLARPLQRVIAFDFLNYSLHDSARNVMQLNVIESADAQDLPRTLEMPIGNSCSGWVWQTQQPLVLNDVAGETRFQPATSILLKHGISSY